MMLLETILMQLELSDTIELHHARDILTIGLSQLAITNLIQHKNTTANKLSSLYFSFQK